jgi:hypothetical protein
MARRNLSIELDAALDDCKACSTSMSWPLPVSHRLDQLVERAARARTDRAELVAALVAAAPASEGGLTELVLAYREKSAGDVLLDLDSSGNRVLLPRPGPGRRPRK